MAYGLLFLKAVSYNVYNFSVFLARYTLDMVICLKMVRKTTVSQVKAVITEFYAGRGRASLWSYHNANASD